MKIKIIKDYEPRPGRTWKAGMNADVLDENALQIIKDGFAREMRIEKHKADNGAEFEVEVEIVDNKGTTIKTKVDNKSKA